MKMNHRCSPFISSTLQRTRPKGRETKVPLFFDSTVADLISALHFIHPDVFTNRKFCVCKTRPSVGENVFTDPGAGTDSLLTLDESAKIGDVILEEGWELMAEAEQRLHVEKVRRSRSMMHVKGSGGRVSGGAGGADGGGIEWSTGLAPLGAWDEPEAVFEESGYEANWGAGMPEEASPGGSQIAGDVLSQAGETKGNGKGGKNGAERPDGAGTTGGKSNKSSPSGTKSSLSPASSKNKTAKINSSKGDSAINPQTKDQQKRGSKDTSAKEPQKGVSALFYPEELEDTDSASEWPSYGAFAEDELAPDRQKPRPSGAAANDPSQEEKLPAGFDSSDWKISSDWPEEYSKWPPQMKYSAQMQKGSRSPGGVPAIPEAAGEEDWAEGGADGDWSNYGQAWGEDQDYRERPPPKNEINVDSPRRRAVERAPPLFFYWLDSDEVFSVLCHFPSKIPGVAMQPKAPHVSDGSAGDFTGDKYSPARKAAASEKLSPLPETQGAGPPIKRTVEGTVAGRHRGRSSPSRSPTGKILRGENSLSRVVLDGRGPNMMALRRHDITVRPGMTVYELRNRVLGTAQFMPPEVDFCVLILDDTILSEDQHFEHWTELRDLRVTPTSSLHLVAVIRRREEAFVPRVLHQV